MLNFNSMKPWETNIYWNHCRQLEEYLKDNGFLVDTVSRVDVGDTEFYHIEINVPSEDWDYEKTNHHRMGELLGVEKIGLVDFYDYKGYKCKMIHECILIDEEELHDKYLMNEDLVFPGTVKVSLGGIPIGLVDEFEWESKNFNQDKESNHEQAMRKLEEALKLLNGYKRGDDMYE